MNRCILFIMIFTAAAVTGDSFSLETPVYCGGTDDVISYDDGTAYWMNWNGLYRAVWFDMRDFLPGYTGVLAEYTEYWFYHNAQYPWDTSNFYAELWNGGVSAPATLLDRTTIMATHYTAVVADYSPYILTETEFWGVVNISVSSGGWPSIVGDNTPNSASHSFFSDDFIVWEPWVIQGPTANDYFIRVCGSPPFPVVRSSWGAIKGLFR